MKITKFKIYCPTKTLMTNWSLSLIQRTFKISHYTRNFEMCPDILVYLQRKHEIFLNFTVILKFNYYQ